VEARALVAAGYREELTLATLAAALASSPRQIQRAYADCGGGCFREDLRARRLQAAAELLAGQPSIAVAEVARLVGYPRAAHFSRVFRACFGVTPGEFRARARTAGSADAGEVRAGQLQRPPAGGEPTKAGEGGDSSARSRTGGAGSSPGSRSRISVPPPGAASALIAPPC
jgi:AraC-like DNA-binding protein